jgi:DNA polymerase III delta subunit
MKQVLGRDLAASYLLVGAESLRVEEALTALRDALLTDDFTNFTALPREPGGVLVDDVLAAVLGTSEPTVPARDESQQQKLEEARRRAEAFDGIRYQGRESEVDQILMQVRTPPFMARRRLVIVRDFDLFRKDGQQKLLAELRKESPVCRLVLTAQQSDKTLEKLINSADCARYRVEIPAADRTEAGEFIEQWARRNRVKFSDDARQLLIEVCAEGALETNLSVLQNELEKLKTALGSAPAPTITREAVRDLCGRWREYQVGEFVDAMARRNRALALTNLRHLDNWNESPVKIVAWLAGRFLRMLAYGFGDARYWGKPEIARALRALAGIDMKLKRGHPEPYYLLETFVMRRAAPARPAAG